MKINKLTLVTVLFSIAALTTTSAPGIGGPSQSISGVSHGLGLADSFELNFTAVVNNTEPAPTGTYQQSLSFDPCLVVGLNANLSNLRIEYPNGTPIQTWIQSTGCADTLIWLNLFNIPARGDQILNILPETSFQLSAIGPTGEAASLSPIYGEWDNGARVFPLYDNFSGTSLSREWGFTLPENTGYRVSNGLDVYSTVAPDGGGIWSTAAYSGAFWAEVDFLSVTTDGGTPGVDLGLSTQAPSWGSAGGPGSSYTAIVTTNQTNFGNTYLGYVSVTGALSLISSNLSFRLPAGVLGVAWPSAGVQKGEVNGVEVNSATDSSLPFGPVYMSVGISGARYSVTDSLFQWARLRAYPPEGVMPSTSVSVVERTIPSGPTSPQSTCSAFAPSVPLFGGQCEAISFALIAAIGAIVVLSVLLVFGRRRKPETSPAIETGT